MKKENKFDQLVEVVLTKGLLNAYMRGGKVKAECPDCGTLIPTYPGKYGNCPYCGNQFLSRLSPKDQEGGDLVYADDDCIDATDDPTYRGSDDIEYDVDGNDPYGIDDIDCDDDDEDDW